LPARSFGREIDDPEPRKQKTYHKEPEGWRRLTGQVRMRDRKGFRPGIGKKKTSKKPASTGVRGERVPSNPRWSRFRKIKKNDQSIDAWPWFLTTNEGKKLGEITFRWGKKGKTKLSSKSVQKVSQGRKGSVFLPVWTFPQKQFKNLGKLEKSSKPERGALGERAL